MVDDFLHPPLLRVRHDVDCLIAILAGVVDAPGDVITLGLQHVGEVELKRRLIPAHDEHVRITLGVNAHQRAHTIAILVVQLNAIPANDLVVNACLLHFKTRGVNQYIDLVLFAIKHRAIRGDLGDAFAMRIDEMHIGAVVGGQVLIVKTRPLAHEHVPGLQRICGRFVFDDFIDPRMNAHHVIDVAVFLTTDFFVSRHGGEFRFLLRRELRFGQRTSAPRRLPTRFQFARPIRICGPIVTHIDRRRRALKYVQRLCHRAKARNGLHCRRTGADDADHLVR